MALQDIINDLIANNAKTDSSHYTVDQLKNLIANTSIDVPNAQPGATILTYSGKLNDTIYAWEVAEPIGEGSNGQIRTIGQTEAGKLLNRPEFKEALLKAAGGNDDLVTQILDGTTTNGVRNPDSLGDAISQRFIAAADGPIVSMTSNADPTRIWAQTELDTALNNSNVPSINGIPREDLARLKSDLLANGTAADATAADRIILDHVNHVSAQQVSELKIAMDVNGNVSVGTTDYFAKIGLPDIGTDLSPSQIGHSPAEWIGAQQTSQALHNAQLANDYLIQYGQERLPLAEATGDAGKIADAANYLNKLGIIGDVIGLALVAHEANAAYAAGDTAGAQQILSNWALDYAGGLAGGIAAAQLVSTALAPLYLTGPAGAILAGGLSILAGVLGGIGGEQLAHDIADFFTTATQAIQPIRRDPLVLDLDNDGLETTCINTTNPIRFDHDADGIKTATGWVKPDDAFLVLDKNVNGVIDNGRELFGDAMLKSNGQLATDGFDALRDLDSNADGKINSGDAKFGSLRLWRDLNQDGVSQSNELFTLGSQNIAAINVASTDHSEILSNGNQIADLGSYVKTDGTVATIGEVTGNLADINLAQDTFHSQFTDHLDTSAVANLPDMQACPERSRRGAGQNFQETANDHIFEIRRAA